MGVGQSNQRQNRQQYDNYQPQYYDNQNTNRFQYVDSDKQQTVSRSQRDISDNNEDVADDIVNSKDYFYYIVALKDKNDKPIPGYDLMIAVDRDHKIQLTKVMSKEDYKVMTDNKNFKSAAKAAAKKRGGNFNRNNGLNRNANQYNNCPPCNCNMQQQQIQYQDDSTFGQSAMTGFGLGVGFIGAAVVASLLLPSFNYIGYGYYDHFGGYGNYTEINNVTNIYEDNDVNIQDNDVIGDNNDVGNDMGNVENDGNMGDYDYGDGGFEGGKRGIKGKGKKGIKQVPVKKNIKKVQVKRK